MKITKFKNGTVVISENLTVTNGIEVEAEADLDLEEKDAEDIRKDPFSYEFEFDTKGKLKKIQKGTKQVKPKGDQNI